MTLEKKAMNMNLQNYIAQIWMKFDLDNNGTLDKEEFKLFIQECANLLGSDNSALTSL